MKKLVLLALVLLALFTGVACLDVSPLPVLERETDSSDAGADAGEDGG